jgi:hypothetical protein
MNKIIYITALFFSVLGFSQSISGKVETEEGFSIGNVLVINIKTNEKVNTDENGKFTISAKLQDEIRFVKKGYDRVSHIVKSADFDKHILLQMRKSETAINEVVIISKSKIDRLKKDIEVPTVKKGTESKPKPAKWKDVLALDIDAFEELITGNARRKKTRYKYEEMQADILQVKEFLGEEYFIENKIPSERIHEFLEFSIIEKPEIKKHMKTGNQTQIMMILEELFPIYHKRLETNNIDKKNE